MASGYDYTGFARLLGATAHDLRRDAQGQVLREGRHVQCQEGFASHGIDVGQAVGRRDRSIRISIVDNRGEEVRGDHEGARLVQAPDSCVIRRRESDQQIRVVGRIKNIAHGAQNLRQRFRVDLGGSTRAGGETRQSNLFAAGPLLVHLLLGVNAAPPCAPCVSAIEIRSSAR